MMGRATRKANRLKEADVRKAAAKAAKRLRKTGHFGFGRRRRITDPDEELERAEEMEDPT